MRVSYFGFKVAKPPADATLVLDARSLPNPHGHPACKGMDDIQKRRWVQTHPEARALAQKGADHLLANPDGRVAVGCLYGIHRSRAVAELIRSILFLDRAGIGPSVLSVGDHYAAGAKKYPQTKDATARPQGTKIDDPYDGHYRVHPKPQSDDL